MVVDVVIAFDDFNAVNIDVDANDYGFAAKD